MGKLDLNCKKVRNGWRCEARYNSSKKSILLPCDIGVEDNPIEDVARALFGG